MSLIILSCDICVKIFVDVVVIWDDAKSSHFYHIFIPDATGKKQGEFRR